MFTNILKKSNYIFILLSVVILAFIYRSVSPFLKYIFILSLLPLVIVLLKNKSSIYFNVIFLKKYTLVVLTIFLLILKIIQTDIIYIEVIKELINSIILFVIFYILTFFINIETVLNFKKYLIVFIIFLGTFFSIISIVGIFNSYSYFEFRNIDTSNLSLIDYNFALIPSFFAFIGILYYSLKNARFNKVIVTLILVVNSLNILLSGSKRGLLLFLLIVLVQLFIIILILFKYRENFKFLVKIFLNFTVTIFLFLFISICFIYFTNGLFKIRILRFFNVNNIVYFQENLTTKIYRYYLIIGSDKSYNELYSQIWEQSFDPKNPDSGWGISNRDVIFPLYGKNKEIIPNGAIGFCLDSTSKSISHNATSYSFNKVIEVPAKKNDGILFSVYCYVPVESNISRVGIYSEGYSDRRRENYDLNKKGTWQHLSMICKCFGDATIPFYFTAEIIDSHGFRNLQGKLIFAYPQFKLLKDFYKFNPKNPITWGIEGTKTCNISGLNSKIVPNDVIGYLIDSTSNNAISFNEKALILDKINEIEFNYDSMIEFSAYCYVSIDCNASNIGLYAEGTADKKRSLYNMRNKGYWQKITLITDCKRGIVPFFFIAELKNSNNLKSLKGRIVFAHPTFNIIKSSINHFSDLNFTKENNNQCAFNEGIILSLNLINLKIDKFMELSENTYDSTDFIIKSDIKISNNINAFGVDRISRWKFAIEIWNKEYNFKQKIFGGGFKFLNWYGYFFLGDKTKTDYPHNPFLHILLYSGILGVVLYILLLYKVFYYYIKYIKEYYLFFIFFLITYFFTFFSGGNPFDPPIMGFFMMLPFFIHYIHEKDKTEIGRQGIKLKIQVLLFKVRNFRSKI